MEVNPLFSKSWFLPRSIHNLCMLVILSLITSRSMAECYYTNFELKLEITTTDGRQMIAYQSISACKLNLDSTESKHLISALQKEARSKTIKLYKFRSFYRYCTQDSWACNETEMASIYHHFEAFELDAQQVKSIKLLDRQQVSSTEHISSELELKDTLMFHQRPIQIIRLWAFLCDFNVAVFKSDPVLDGELKNLLDFKQELHELHKNRDYSNGDEMDAQALEIIDRINKLDGAIVVSACGD